MMALFQRAEIKKSEIHWLLHFEDERRRNKHPGDVRLDRVNFWRPVRIRGGRFKKRNQRLVHLHSIVHRCRSSVEAYDVGGSVFLATGAKSALETRRNV